MKANEAPEKIILSADRDTQIINYEWVVNDYTDNIKIEYVRKDAFIEKAVNFLEMLGCGFTITDNITHANYGKEQLIEDFRKYMEGE